MSRKIVMLLAAVLFNCVTGGVLAAVMGASPAAGMLCMNAVGVAAGMVNDGSVVLRAGVYTEIWTGELVKTLRSGLAGSWLDGVPDQSSIVNNDVIHLVEVGVDPGMCLSTTRLTRYPCRRWTTRTSPFPLTSSSRK